MFHLVDLSNRPVVVSFVQVCYLLKSLWLKSEQEHESDEVRCTAGIPRCPIIAPFAGILILLELEIVLSFEVYSFIKAY